VLPISNGLADITMLIATVHIYIRNWTQYPFLLPQTVHSESRLFVCTVAKNIEKRGGGFDFIFLSFDSRR
jgi:hypothetical protein